MERNLKQLVASYSWLIGLLHDIVGESLEINEQSPTSEEVHQFVQDFIEANTPIPKVSELIKSKEFFAERVSGNKSEIVRANVLTDEDVLSIFRMVQLGQAINDIEVDLEKPAPKSEIRKTIDRLRERPPSLASNNVLDTLKEKFDKGYKSPEAIPEFPRKRSKSAQSEDIEDEDLDGEEIDEDEELGDAEYNRKHNTRG